MAVRTSTGFASRILGPESFATIFQGGSIEIRSGTQPASADEPATGTLLARITRDGLLWTAGSPTNGLEFVNAGRYASKNFSHSWRLKGIAAGTAGWFRLVGNAPDDGGTSTTLPRIDGAIGLLPAEGETLVGDFQMLLPSLAITIGLERSIDQWYYAIPPIGL